VLAAHEQAAPPDELAIEPEIIMSAAQLKFATAYVAAVLTPVGKAVTKSANRMPSGESCVPAVRELQDDESKQTSRQRPGHLVPFTPIGGVFP
jgi:hypothetical protein